MTIKQGKFITIEGQDGAGKTTNLDVICNYLKAINQHTLVTREPGGTDLGESIRGLILESDTPITPVSELLLMFAARAQHIEQVIKPALALGQWVICDRFTDATYAYQGGGHQVDLNLIKQVETTATQGFTPDLTILLDVEVELGLQRTDSRGEQKDRFERQADSFKHRVRDQYLQRHKSEPERIKLIDASVSISNVKHSIESVLSKYIEEQQA